MGAQNSTQDAADIARELEKTPRANELIGRVQTALEALGPRDFREPEATFQRRRKLELLILHLGWYPTDGVDVNDQVYEAVMASVVAPS